VIDLAHALGIATVAEGIETPRHLAMLQDLGCAYGQGYLWSPPVPAKEATLWTREGTHAASGTQ
jgi:EAL domain-containing protein (putative c-di-GMP-specific phosphodiesterase class I)